MPPPPPPPPLPSTQHLNMAIGKNKKLKKGGRKKVIDPFTRKEWYSAVAPAMFSERDFGKTICNRTAGLKIASDSLKGRVFEVSLADLNNDQDQSFKKMRMVVEEVRGDQLLTNFDGMCFTRDKLCGLVKKWHTLIEAFCDVKTTDGYTLRLFCIGFTKKRRTQYRKTSYAQGAQVRGIRQKMIDVMRAESSRQDLRAMVDKFVAESIGKEVEKACNNIYPLNNVFIRKVKVLKKPRFDLTKLMELHTAKDEGLSVDRIETGEIDEIAGEGGRL